jgi:hypothetical protein
MLAPGLHTITARYATREDRGNYYEDTSTGYITLVHDFQPGGYYYMYGETAGKQIQFKIEEDANQSRVRRGEKKKSSLSYPKKIAPAVANGKLLGEALLAGPTKFEGVWKGTAKQGASILGTTGQVSYVFEGKLYYLVSDTSVLSSWAGTGDDASEVGTFDYTDTALILTPLKKRSVGFLSLKSVLKNEKNPKKTEYAYTLNGDTLTLSSEGKPLGTLVKQATAE